MDVCGYEKKESKKCRLYCVRNDELRVEMEKLRHQLERMRFIFKKFYKIIGILIIFVILYKLK